MTEPDTELTEDERALLWRANQRRQRAAQQAAWAALAGDPEARARVHRAWAPLVMALHERQMPDTEPEENPYGTTFNVGQ